MKRLAIIVVCILFFIVGVVWRAPAWLLSDVAGEQLAGVELGVAKGSLWRGEFSHVGVQGVTLRGVSWQLSPLQSFSGKPLALSVAEPANVSLTAGVKGDALLISGLTATGRLAPVLEAIQVPAMGFDGVFNAQASEASLTAQGCQSLTGNVEIGQLSGDIDGLESLGQIRAEVSCDAGRLRIVIDEANPHRLRGTVTLDARGVPRGQISLTPPPQSDIYRSLSQMFGRPRNGKDFTLRL
ncbi:MAG: type II secretion system protein N [Spongiibacter marinus]|uniref:type II secretion system protein N n=1 Tax=Spongiibacter marinus TaxID=354246 RepID=UPI003C364270